MIGISESDDLRGRFKGGNSSMYIIRKSMIIFLAILFIGAGTVSSFTNIKASYNENQVSNKNIEGLYPTYDKDSQKYCFFAQKYIDLVPKYDNDYSKSIINLNTQSGCSYNISSNSNNKKWTWLFYNDADFTPAYDPFNDFKGEAFSGENLNVVMLRDTYGGPAQYWYIDEVHNADLLEELGEVDMGDSGTLLDFIEYGKEHFPADRYLLSFYNHGGGWEGACRDDTDNGWLTMDEIQQAITYSGGVDLVLFTAPCLMGAFESAYELKDCIDVYIGSQEGSGYAHWIGTIEMIADTLENNPDITTNNLGTKVIETIWKKTSNKDVITMSAIKTDSLSYLSDAIDLVSVELIKNHSKYYETISSIYNDIQSFGNGEYLDLYHLSEVIKQENLNANLNNDLQKVKDRLSNSVLAECHGLNYPNAHGLTIYFPDPLSYNYNQLYTDHNYRLDVSLNTSWDDFIQCYSNDPRIDQYQKKYLSTGMLLCQRFSWAQSFIPIMDTLTKIKIKIDRFGNGNSSVILSIREHLKGPDLTSVTISYDSIPSSNIEWISFDFPDIKLKPGTQYYIVISTEGESDGVNSSYTWYGSNNSYSYENGEIWIYWSNSDIWERWNPSVDGSFMTFYNSSTLNNPVLTGPASGKINKLCEYQIYANDSKNNDVFYYIDWGDGSNTGWLGPFESSQMINISHKWLTEGSYLIKAKAKNNDNQISDWVALEITMPKSKPHFIILEERFPYLFNLLSSFL